MDENHDDEPEERLLASGQGSGDEPEKQDEPGPIRDGSRWGTKRTPDDRTQA